MRGTDRPRLTIVVPAYNDAAPLARVLASLKTPSKDFAREVIVIDDGSTDDTSAVAAAAGARLIRRNRNLGYGASLKSGIRAAATEYVLTMDSDGQHQAEDVDVLWNLASQYDMVVGERTGLLHSPLWRMPGKWLLSRFWPSTSRGAAFPI